MGQQCLRPFAVYPAALSLLLLTPFLQSCGGGGSGDGGAGGNGGGNDADPSSVQSLFEKQNSAAVNYFRTLGRFYDLIKDHEEELFNIDPTDLEAQNAHITKVANNLSSIRGILNKELDSIIALETNFQDISEAGASGVISSSSSMLEPQIEPITIVSGCAIALSATSWWVSRRENLAGYFDDWEKCAAERNQKWGSLPPPDGTNEKERQDLIGKSFDEFLDCKEEAGNDLGRNNLINDLAVLGANFSPQLIAWKGGQVLIKGASALLDAANVWIFATNPSVEPNLLSPHAIRNDRNFFVSRTSENGEFYAPVGEWNITAFKDGYIRFGTSDAQRIVVRENQRTSVVANPTLVSEGEAFRQSCKTGGVPDENGAPAGSFRGHSYYNFDSSVGSDLARADIKVSGSTSFPTISWDRNITRQCGDVATIIVHDSGEGPGLYGLSANFNEMGVLVPLAPPLQYGDYSRPNTFRLAGYPSISPAMVPGRRYDIVMGCMDFVGFATLTFSVE